MILAEREREMRAFVVSLFNAVSANDDFDDEEREDFEEGVGEDVEHKRSERGVLNKDAADDEREFDDENDAAN